MASFGTKSYAVSIIVDFLPSFQEVYLVAISYDKPRSLRPSRKARDFIFLLVILVGQRLYHVRKDLGTILVENKILDKDGCVAIAVVGEDGSLSVYSSNTVDAEVSEPLAIEFGVLTPLLVKDDVDHPRKRGAPIFLGDTASDHLGEACKVQREIAGDLSTTCEGVLKRTAHLLVDGVLALEVAVGYLEFEGLAIMARLVEACLIAFLVPEGHVLVVGFWGRTPDEGSDLCSTKLLALRTVLRDKLCFVHSFAVIRGHSGLRHEKLFHNCFWMFNLIDNI
jgi:hypothetical protein